ncbi:tyrosine-type recombinase/integrase [Pseudomonas sp. FEN]|uniref:tyrosine-type recombinase/integrase n=1 Tax=Pseudomonas sp. FEN TaxID=2767468 RepID=UPI00198A91C5|nr:tyrosine-type recombinase/integrase [Pseudomonas sp. FEN]CAD5202150.1 hypothetical protein [Pseudomonas sp. FEN]
MNLSDARPTGRYEKVLLTDLHLWQPCEEDDAGDWIDPRDPSFESPRPYPIKPMRAAPERIGRHYVIVQPDGALWRDGSLYLLERAIHGAMKAATCANIAGDLAHLMNALLDEGVDSEAFEGPTFKRPTYAYQAVLRKQIGRGELSRKTANRKLSSMTGLYRWKVSTKGFLPTQEMWKESKKIISGLDRHGFQWSKTITKTDLTFSVTEENPNPGFIEDGGKLRPLTREEQQALIEALVKTNNPEMMLIFFIALTSGMRAQSILTLRASCINRNADQLPENTLIPITMGDGTLIDTKNNKRMAVKVPAWVHLRISDYLNSDRYKERAKKSHITNPDDQYVFLTRTGKPYYDAQEDMDAMKNRAESGSAIRQFKRQLEKIIAQTGNAFKFQFHDLRATFGMNLLEDHMKNSKSELKELEALEMVRSRLNHSSLEVTRRYLNFRKTQGRVSQAQSGFEAHLRTIIDGQLEQHEIKRTHDQHGVPG